MVYFAGQSGVFVFSVTQAELSMQEVLAFIRLEGKLAAGAEAL